MTEERADSLEEDNQNGWIQNAEVFTVVSRPTYYQPWPPSNRDQGYSYVMQILERAVHRPGAGDAVPPPRWARCGIHGTAE